MAVEIIKSEVGADRFTKWGALLKCISKDKIKIAVARVLVDGTDIVTTDDRRMAVLNNTENLSNGQYEVVVRTGTEIVLEKVDKDDEYNYPHWQDIIEKCKKPLTTLVVKRDNNSGNADAVFSIARAVPKKFTVNIRYIKEALIDSATVYIYEGYTPIQFFTPDLRIFIMYREINPSCGVVIENEF